MHLRGPFALLVLVAVLALTLIHALWSGRFYLRNIADISRSDAPGQYWFAIAAMLSTIAILVLLFVTHTAGGLR